MSKLALIFGGSGDIGHATARLLSSNGWKIALASRKEDYTIKELDIEYYKSVDAIDPVQVESVFTELGEVNAVVNCVGSIVLKPAHLTSDKDFTDIINTNLKSAFNVVRASAKNCPRDSSVVLMSSCAASIGLAYHEAISAAKAGVEGLVRSAAATYAQKGIRFNAVAPGLVDTKLSRKITANPQALASSQAMHALSRIGNVEDIASAIHFLINSSWITGEIIKVDGGLSTTKLNSSKVNR